MALKTMTELEALPDRCEEANDRLSGSRYVPCNAPATHRVRQRDGRELRVCDSHHFHNVKNRGSEDLGKYTPSNPNRVAGQEPVYDYSRYSEQPKSNGELGKLADLAEQARQAEYAVEEAQRNLKRLQDQHRHLVEQEIPTLMEQVGMEKFSTSSGLNIEIKEAIRASLGSGPEKERNLDWLEQNGHEAIIKLAVAVPFGRGDEQRDAARALASELREKGFDQASFERKVEPSTLGALIRELLEEGRPVPEEFFHVFRQRMAKIK